MVKDDFELFKGKKLSNLFEDIYVNQISKKAKLVQYIDELKQYIKHTNDAVIFAPIISNLLDTSLKNDDQLIKLATIAQRIMVAEKKGEAVDGVLTEAEKRQLLETLDDIQITKSAVNDEVEQITNEVQRLKEKNAKR
jgi:hypothetical protein